jgi:hypothetical protein
MKKKLQKACGFVADVNEMSEAKNFTLKSLVFQTKNPSCVFLHYKEYYLKLSIIY